MTLPDQVQISIARVSNPNVSDRTHPARDRQTGILLLLALPSIPSSSSDNIPITISKDSRSPKRAHRLAHRRSDNIHHPLRGLEAATGSGGGDLGGTGESCAAERGGHAEGHIVVCAVGSFV